MKFLHRVLSCIPWLLVVILGLTPLLFLPMTQDYYDLTKWMAIVLVTVCISGVWLARMLAKPRPIEVTISPAVLGFGGLALVSILSLILISPNKVEAMLSPYGPAVWISFLLLFLLGSSAMDHTFRKRLRTFLYISSTTLGLIAIYQFFGMGKFMFPTVSFLSDSLWTPTGSSIATITVCMLLLPMLIGDTRVAIKAKREIPIALFTIATLVIIAGLGVTIWQLIPKFTGTVLSPLDGWAITLEVLKNPARAVIGVGAENFVSAFTAGRPASLNLTSLWGSRFMTNASVFLHLLSIYGVLGGAACLWLAKQLFSKKADRPLQISLVVAIVALFLTPPSIAILTVITCLFMLSTTGNAVVWHIPTRFQAIRFALSGIGLVLLLIVTYGLVRSYIAETTFYQSLLAAQANNGTKTYNAQIQAIQRNPAISRFHVYFSQTNMALATALADSITQQVATKSAESVTNDRNLVGQLVQQAIREAKLALALNQDNILAWENLARTYQRLINIAQGADNWSVTAYQKAIELDPNNPTLHLELGGVYTQTKNNSQAITEFQVAAALKPDYANAYYNLANAYTLNGDLPKALEAMQKTLTLVSPNSPDYQIVQGQIDSLKKNQPAGTTTPTNKTPNTTTPSPSAVPSLTLPKN